MGVRLGCVVEVEKGRGMRGDVGDVGDVGDWGACRVCGDGVKKARSWSAKKLGEQLMIERSRMIILRKGRVLSGGCAIAMGVFMLGGCHFTPAIDEAPVVMPGQFGGLEEVGHQKRDVLPERWWEVFDDPILDQMIEEALTNNFSIQSAWAKLEASRAAAVQAGAGFYPAVDLKGSGQRSRNEINAAGKGQREGVAYNSQFSFGLVASYEVDLWGRVKAQKEAAVAEVEGSELDLRAAGITLSSQIASNWFKLITQEMQLQLVKDQVATNEKYLEVLKGRFNVGLIGASDVLQQEQLVESTKSNLAMTRAQIRVLENQLDILTGRVPGEFAYDVPGELPRLKGLPEMGLPGEVLNRRPDVMAMYKRLEAANYRTAMAIANRLPRLSLTVSGSTDAASLSDLFSNWLGTMAANLASPVFDAGNKAAEVDRQRAMYKQNYAAWGQSILDALKEIEDALVQEHGQSEYLKSIEKQIKTAKLVEGEVKNNYKNGNGDFLRVLTAEQSLQNLQRQQYTANQQLVDYRIALCRALAGGWDMQPFADGIEESE